MSITNERLDEIERDVGPAAGNSEVIYMARELKALRERYRWIPATERLPPEEWRMEGLYVAAITHDGSSLIVPAFIVVPFDFTHWREIDMPEGV